MKRDFHRRIYHPDADLSLSIQRQKKMVGAGTGAGAGAGAGARSWSWSWSQELELRLLVMLVSHWHLLNEAEEKTMHLEAVTGAGAVSMVLVEWAMLFLGRLICVFYLTIILKRVGSDEGFFMHLLEF